MRSASAAIDHAAQDHRNILAWFSSANGRQSHSGGPRTHVHDLNFSVQASFGQPGWQDDANCLGVDPDLFFPERGASTREAKEVCRGCVVRERVPRVRPRQRREVRHLGRDERA